MVPKYIELGRVLPPHHQISSRKMIAKRMNMFGGFLKFLTTEVIQDSLTVPVQKLMSFWTDFETTLPPFLLGDNLLKVYIQTNTWLIMSCPT